jgi:alkylhydroperoxidase family enzyme
MHSKDALALGERDQRLHVLPAWREAPFYTDRERAALRWTEHVTLVSQDNASRRKATSLAAWLGPRLVPLDLRTTKSRLADTPGYGSC